MQNPKFSVIQPVSGQRMHKKERCKHHKTKTLQLNSIVWQFSSVFVPAPKRARMAKARASALVRCGKSKIGRKGVGMTSSLRINPSLHEIH